MKKYLSILVVILSSLFLAPTLAFAQAGNFDKTTVISLDPQIEQQETGANVMAGEEPVLVEPAKNQTILASHFELMGQHNKRYTVVNVRDLKRFDVSHDGVVTAREANDDHAPLAIAYIAKGKDGKYCLRGAQKVKEVDYDLKTGTVTAFESNGKKLYGKTVTLKYNSSFVPY